MSTWNTLRSYCWTWHYSQLTSQNQICCLTILNVPTVLYIFVGYKCFSVGPVWKCSSSPELEAFLWTQPVDESKRTVKITMVSPSDITGVYNWQYLIIITICFSKGNMLLRLLKLVCLSGHIVTKNPMSIYFLWNTVCFQIKRFQSTYGIHPQLYPKVCQLQILDHIWADEIHMLWEWNSWELFETKILVGWRREKWRLLNIIHQRTAI